MEDQLPVEELEALAHEEVGEALRRTRLFYGQTLEDVQKALRIRSCQIEAIENGDLTDLPGRVYAIGFVRSYAEYLGLDGGKTVQLFKAQYMDGTAGKARLSFSVPASETKTPALWFATLTLLLACALFMGWHHYKKPERGNIAYIEVVPESIRQHVEQDLAIQSSVAVEDPITSDVRETNIVEDMSSDENQSGIILNIIGNSWVEIKNGNGEVVVSNILERGDQYFVPDSPGLSMSLGNAANVEIIVEGQTLMPLGKNGDVRRDIPLNISYLKTLEFKVEKPSDPALIEENSQ